MTSCARPIFDSQEKPRKMSSTTADAAVSSPSLAARDHEERRVSLFTLCLRALGVGIMTGVGAVVLRSLIGLITKRAIADAVIDHYAD
jgi:CIC family chloride channel protein